MDGIVRILGIPGSLRKASFNRAALRAAEELVPADASLEIFDLEGIPPFSEDDERALPTRVVELKARIREADAILIATPEYNYSIPGVLKNAIDWASRPYGDNAWDGKPVAIMGASVGGTGTARAQFEVDEGGSLNAWRAGALRMRRSPVVQVAGDVVVRSEREQGRRGVGAARHRVRAARAEAATRGRIYGARRIAGDGWALQSPRGIHGRGRGEERLRVGVLRRLGERIHRAGLDNLAEVHDEHPA
jgi:hypothetical protein